MGSVDNRWDGKIKVRDNAIGDNEQNEVIFGGVGFGRGKVSDVFDHGRKIGRTIELNARHALLVSLNSQQITNACLYALSLISPSR